jgi:hypothetical protein
MVGYEAAPWGLFGSFAAVGFELCNALRRDGQWPWKRPSKPGVDEIPEAGAVGYAVAAGIRLIIGAGLAWAAASTGQISGSLGAMIVGVAAPKIIEQLAKTIPLSITPELHGLDAAANPVSSARKHAESLLPAIEVDGAARAVD